MGLWHEILPGQVNSRTDSEGIYWRLGNRKNRKIWIFRIGCISTGKIYLITATDTVFLTKMQKGQNLLWNLPFPIDQKNQLSGSLCSNLHLLLFVYSILHGFSRDKLRDHFLCNLHGLSSLRISTLSCASLVDLKGPKSYKLNGFIFPQCANNFW